MSSNIWEDQRVEPVVKAAVGASIRLRSSVKGMPASAAGGGADRCLRGLGCLLKGAQRRREGRLALDAEAVKELGVLVLAGVGCRQQLVTRKDRVGARHEHHRLLQRREGHAPGREAHHRPRHDDARGRDRARHLEDVWRAVDVEGRAVDGHERVDRDRLWVLRHGGKLVEQADAVVLGLAEPQDAAATDGDARLAHVGDGLKPVVVRARGDDVGVVLARRIQVVVVRRQAGLLQVASLLL
mmetsp:Transcript_33585/g.70683  ORF Transcript_33585/g.70683 Transcript_33585/m.70683 type:complete len:241 (+) Transcript_33585:496-1218(+)